MDAVRRGNIQDQHGVDRHAHHDQESLKRQGGQGFEIVVAHLTPFTVGHCRQRDRRYGYREVYLDHAAEDDNEDTYGHDLHAQVDDKDLQPQPDEFPDAHGFQHRPQIRKRGAGAHIQTALYHARAGVDHLLRQAEHAHDDVEGVGQDKNGAECLEHPFIYLDYMEIVHVVSVNDHLNEFITHNKCQYHPRNRDDGGF